VPLPYQVAAARARGQRVIGEPVASGLAVSEERLWHPNFSLAAQYVMSPPIRSEAHRQAVKKVRQGGGPCGGHV
jgi:dihydropyrimidinase